MKIMFKYDVNIHFVDLGWDEYEVNANCIDMAILIGLKRVINEISEERANKIDLVKVYKHKTDKILKTYYIE